MPNVISFGASTDNAVVNGTLKDRMPINPINAPTGMQVIGPRVTFNFIEEAWSKDNSYQYYDVVQIDGNSYVARQNVPTGIDITNADYWFHWADPNAQFNELQNIVNSFENRLSKVEDAITVTSHEKLLDENDLKIGSLVIINSALYEIVEGSSPNNITTYATGTANCIAKAVYGTVVLANSVSIADTITVENITLDLDGNSIISSMVGNMIECKNAIIKNGTIQATTINNENRYNACIFGVNYEALALTLIGNNCVNLTNNSDYTHIIGCTLSPSMCAIYSEDNNGCNGVIIDGCIISAQPSGGEYVAWPQILVRNGFSNGDQINDSILSNKSHGFTINNCVFGNPTQRNIYIANYSDVVISNVETNNPISDSAKGGSGDSICVDLCTNVNINKCIVNNSGENGIDILSSTNVTITNCTLNNIHYNVIILDISDAVSDGGYTGNYDNLYCNDVYINNVHATAYIDSESSDQPTFVQLRAAMENVTVTDCEFVSPCMANSKPCKLIAYTYFTKNSTQYNTVIGNNTFINVKHIITDLYEYGNSNAFSNLTNLINQKEGTKTIIIDCDLLFTANISNVNTSIATSSPIIPGSKGHGTVYKICQDNTLRSVDYNGNAGVSLLGVNSGQYYLFANEQIDIVPVASAVEYFPELNYQQNQTNGFVCVGVWNA